jgi:RNA polymerase sigma-70 factor (ECF subfamily)
MKDIPYELIQRAALGDMAAFEEIYRMTSGFVYAVSYRITNSRMDAQEAAQDVFMKLHDNLGKFREGTSFGAWLYRITVNTAINYYNKAKRKRGHEVYDEEAVGSAGTEGDADKGMTEEDSEKRAAELLARLSPEHRACIVLREIEGLSDEEMAEALKININTVRSRLKRAREVLMKFAAERGDKDEMR